MVFKIQGNFTEENFDKIFNGLQKYFTILIHRGDLYIALQDYKELDSAKNSLKRLLKPVRDFYVCEINQNNILKEEHFIMEWCRDALVNLDKQRYEFEEQQKLKLVDQALDRMEEILEERMRNNCSETEPD